VTLVHLLGERKVPDEGRTLIATFIPELG
jgi:hypothetical protein